VTTKGIIFSAPMVRALLDGRKTQTRRLCAWPNNPNSPALSYIVAGDEPGWFGDEEGEVQFKAGYVSGDRLYVRENWQALSFGDYTPTKYRPAEIRYAASDPLATLSVENRGYPYRPCIHMRRCDSRLWLAVTDVRVQKLKDISAADAVAEGIDASAASHFGSPIKAYAALWDSLHGADGTTWADNPWIVALSFAVHHGNVDALPGVPGNG